MGRENWGTCSKLRRGRGGDTTEVTKCSARERASSPQGRTEGEVTTVTGNPRLANALLRLGGDKQGLGFCFEGKMNLSKATGVGVGKRKELKQHEEAVTLSWAYEPGRLYRGNEGERPKEEKVKGSGRWADWKRSRATFPRH